MLDSALFWRRLDARVERLVRRLVVPPLRGVLEAVTTGADALYGRVQARYGETVQDVEVAQHYGFASVPSSPVEVVLSPVGGSSAHLVSVAEIDRGLRPTDLASSETEIYSSSGARIRLRANGDIVILADVASGSKVTINGGAKGAARAGDQCSPSVDMVAWMDAVSGALATLTGSPFLSPVDDTYEITGSSASCFIGD